jgi:FkbM family methyltransferase
VRRPPGGAAPGTTPEGDQLHDIAVDGVRMVLADAPSSAALTIIASELGQGAYDFSAIPFEPGDVVVDIGAHVGSVSILLAKAHPEIRVLAYEPIPPVFARLEANLERNDVRNVTAFNRAVTADGRDLDLVVHLESNTGGGTAQVATLDRPGHERHLVPSTTLDAIFDEHRIERCRLLKIDCEGSEYEILLTTRCLDRVDHLRGEFHENDSLRARGYTMDALRRHCERWVGEGRVDYVACEMAQ